MAIKVLPQRLARDDDARARLTREAKAVAGISHPNVLALYEFEQEGDLAYVATELLEGETLRAVLGRGPMPWRRAAEICASIADLTHRPPSRVELTMRTVTRRLHIAPAG